MGLFWDSEDTKEVGNTTIKITSGLRHLFTGEIPPETLAELQRMDDTHVKALWKIDSEIPFWRSSRAIVMMWLNFHSVIGIYIVLYGDVTFNSPAITALLSLTGVANTAFFGSKGIEYVKANKAP